jgi:hypothetical protein
VKHTVADHTEGVEVEWVELNPGFRVAFVLLKDMLDLDLGNRDGTARAAGMRYPVVVRSLDRMGKPTWLRVRGPGGGS